MKARLETKTKDNRALGPWGLWIETGQSVRRHVFGACWCAPWPFFGDTMQLTKPPVCLHVFVMCTLTNSGLLFFCLAVWWRVQRAAGGPGRGSEEGGENQRAGGEDPSPGVPGKSIRRNPIKWLCKIVLEYLQGLSKYRFYSKRKTWKERVVQNNPHQENSKSLYCEIHLMRSHTG